MHVVIIGAGEVGIYVARVLIEDGHDVAIVEQDEDLARRLDATLNALVVHGSGVNPTALQRAGIGRADVLLAVTSLDEVNLIACMTARKFGREGLRVLARVRQSREVAGELALSAEDLGLDALISPEQAITGAAIEDLRFTGSGEMRELAGGRLALVGMDLTPDSPLVHASLEDLRRDFPGEFVVVGVQGSEGRVPSPNERLRSDERVFVLTRQSYLTELAILSGMPWYPVRRVLIVGCGNTGLALARELERLDYQVTVIEIDHSRAERVAGILPGVLVLHGDGSDPEFLKQQIEEREIDTAIVLLKDPEKSVLIGIFASSLGARKAIVRCDKPAYTALATRQGVDAVISPRHAMADSIQRYVRRGRIELSLGLGAVQAEVVHFKLPAKPAHAELYRSPIGSLPFPPGVVAGALIRGDDLYLAPDSMTLQPGDELLLVSQHDSLARVERLLT